MKNKNNKLPTESIIIYGIRIHYIGARKSKDYLNYNQD